MQREEGYRHGFAARMRRRARAAVAGIRIGRVRGERAADLRHERRELAGGTTFARAAGMEGT